MLFDRVLRLLLGPGRAAAAGEPVAADAGAAATGSATRRDLAGRAVRLLAGLSDQQLERLERAPWRWLLLRGLAAALPRTFDPVRAGDLAARIEVAFPRPASAVADRFEIVIAEARCRVRPGGCEDPDLRLRIGLADLLRLVAGTQSLTMQWTSGQLDVSGDPTLVLRLPALFGRQPD